MNFDPSKVTTVYGLLAVIAVAIVAAVGRRRLYGVGGLILSLVLLSIAAAGIYVMIVGKSSFGYSGSARNDLDPSGDTCLDRKAEVIPGGTRVCVNMVGAWAGTWPGGVAPFGARDAPHINGTLLWSEGTGRDRNVFTVASRYTHPNEFVAPEDFVICVRPPAGAKRYPGQPMNIVVAPSAKPCSEPAVP